MWAEKNGKTWRIRDLVGGDKVTVASGFANKTQADQRIVLLKADRLRGDALVHRGGQVLLSDWIELWWQPYEDTLKRSSQVSSRGIRNRYIDPMIGHLTLDELDEMAVQRWVSDLRAGRTHVKNPRKLARKTAVNAHGLLFKIMAAAVRKKLIRANPCTETDFGQRTHHEMTFLTEQEAERLLGEIPEHYQPLILLLLGTGFRWGEAVGLRVKDVDVLTQKLRVRKNLQELADTGELVEEEPKSAMSRRTVKVTMDVASVLIPLVIDKGPDDHVFLAPRGGSVRHRVFFPIWDRARKAAGVPSCRIHDLRHTHAAWLISSNVRGGLTAIQRRLGHASYSVTSDLYGHLTSEVDDDIMDALDARLPKIISRGVAGESVGRQRAVEGKADPVRAGLISSVVPD